MSIKTSNYLLVGKGVNENGQTANFVSLPPAQLVTFLIDGRTAKLLTVDTLTGSELRLSELIYDVLTKLRCAESTKNSFDSTGALRIIGNEMEFDVKAFVSGTTWFGL